MRIRNSGSSESRPRQASTIGRQVGEDVPHLALRPAAEFRRIEDDAVVAVAAPALALDEFHRVLADPADLQRLEPAQRLVLARPADRLLRGVDMGHLGAGPGRHQRGDAGIAEQVEHLQPAARRRAIRVLEPLPVGRLLGKHADMAEIGEAAEEGDAVPGHRPGLAERLLDSASGRRPPRRRCRRICASAALPFGRRPARRPQRLRLRPHDPVGAVALQFLAVAANRAGHSPPSPRSPASPAPGGRGRLAARAGVIVGGGWSAVTRGFYPKFLADVAI